MNTSFQRSAEKLIQLLEIMEKLRSEQGCPWDKEQTFKTLIPFLIEEAYEVVDTLEKSDTSHLKEELGDLLFQIVFHAQLAREENQFDMSEVLQAIIDKLIRRHPHVFGDAKVKDAAEVIHNWEQIKDAEKKQRLDDSILADVPASFPSLLKAYQLGKKAAKVGFDWPDTIGVFAKIKEEIQELEESIQNKEPMAIHEELGDLFFAIVNLSRHFKMNPEEALRQTNEKFIRRFQFIEKKIRAEKKSWDDFSLKELDSFWDEAKHCEYNPQSSTKTV